MRDGCFHDTAGGTRIRNGEAGGTGSAERGGERAIFTATGGAASHLTCHIGSAIPVGCATPKIAANDPRAIGKGGGWSQAVNLYSAIPDGSAHLRARALADLMVLNSPEEQTFDDLVFVAARACAVPIALITLLDTDRQWFKALVGLEVRETEIDHSICQIDIDRGELLEIADLAVDGRTAANPMVSGERHFRSYAGAPLVLRSGIVVGRLCVVDTVPRPEGLGEAAKSMLLALARLASENLELRRAAHATDRMKRLQTALMEIDQSLRDSRDTKRMASATAAIVGRALSADRAGFGSFDEAVQTIDVETEWTAPGVRRHTGRHRLDADGDLHEPLANGELLRARDAPSDERTLHYREGAMRIGVRSLVDVPVRELGKKSAVFFVHSDHPRSWQAEEMAFIRSAADRLEAVVAHHRAEQQQRIVNGEILHRQKNILTMVQAIANQTLRTVADRDAVYAFERRLIALSAAHDTLLKSNWTQTDLRTVADTVIEAVGFADRCALDGPPIALHPRAALSFSLIVHELLTNACKYGALSNDVGGVSLTWLVENGEADDHLVIRWHESGGPPVTAPARRGFGSKLIGVGLVGAGGVDLRYEPSGFSADLKASLHNLAHA